MIFPPFPSPPSEASLASERISEQSEPRVHFRLPFSDPDYVHYTLVPPLSTMYMQAGSVSMKEKISACVHIYRYIVLSGLRRSEAVRDATYILDVLS